MILWNRKASCHALSRLGNAPVQFGQKTSRRVTQSNIYVESPIADSIKRSLAIKVTKDAIDTQYSQMVRLTEFVLFLSWRGTLSLVYHQQRFKSRVQLQWREQEQRYLYRIPSPFETSHQDEPTGRIPLIRSDKSFKGISCLNPSLSGLRGMLENQHLLRNDVAMLRQFTPTQHWY